MKHYYLRHIISVAFLLLCALLHFSACDSVRSKAMYKIGVSQCSYDVWHSQMTTEMRREASYSDSVQLDFRVAADRPDLQIRQIDSLIASGVDLLVICPAEAKALTSAVDRAIDAGIPVMLVDRKVCTDRYTTFVAGNNFAIGHDAATFIASKLRGEASVVEFCGLMSSSPAQERHSGFADGIKDLPRMHLAASVGNAWTTGDVNRQVDSLIKAGTPFNAVFAHCDSLAIAVSRRLRSHGRTDVFIVGIDGLATPGQGLDAVEKGELAASFQYPTGGDRIIQLALRLLQGQHVEKNVTLPSTIITPSTARVYRVQTDLINEREARLENLAGRLNQQLTRYYTQNYLLAALIAIIVLIVALLAVIYRALSSARAKTEELAQQKRKIEEQRDHLVQLSQQLHESTQSKLAFFTGVSHDLRTPLTLILAPLEELSSLGGISPHHRELLDLIETNAHTLQRLVTQTLDFRKFEQGELQANNASFDLGQAFRNWCVSFRALATKRGIRFVANGLDLNVASPYWGDARMLESVVYNLLSNAFKFTPEAGRVSITLSSDPSASDAPERYIITVSDSGRGIDPDKISRIFDRFYQADVTHEGSGIGLATVKTYVELLGGKVEARSEVGHGATFTVSLPVRSPEASLPEMPKTMTEENAFVSEAYASERTMTTADAMPPVPAPAAPETINTLDTSGSNGSEPSKPLVLVIDDNPDIRTYVRLLLADHYVVDEAADAYEGLRRARRLMPDAIVSDVMMPEMDGWELCRRLKTEWQTSHIPVMLLTACALEEQHAKGFDVGADAYMSKPFSPEVFRSQLRSLIANRRRVATFLTDGKLAPERKEASTLDNDFADHFKALLEQQIGEPDLNVEALGAELGLSRTQLYRKVKALTGASPVELMRLMRLKRAAELLSRTQKTIAEVAYECGFSNPSYFAKCFKEHYGTSPSEYVKG